MGALIHIENMKKIYNPGENEVRALDGIDLDIEKGDLVAIVGHSGSGKSTLMNMLGCLDTPTSGKYVLDGQDVAPELLPAALNSLPQPLILHVLINRDAPASALMAVINRPELQTVPMRLVTLRPEEAGAAP